MLTSIQSNDNMTTKPAALGLAGLETEGLTPPINPTHPYVDRNDALNDHTLSCAEDANSSSLAEDDAFTPIHHTLSLAELEAEGNATGLDESSVDVPTLTTGGDENDAITQLQYTLEGIKSQLRDRDSQYQISLKDLASEREKREHVENERDAARNELMVLKRAQQSQEELRRRVNHLSDELIAKCVHVDETEKRFRQAVEDGEKRVIEVTTRLNLETEKVTELKESLSELDSLRKRCRDMENELRALKTIPTDATTSRNETADTSASSETFSKSMMKKKLFELSIARNVIAEKDKILKELREVLETVESRERETDAAKKATESHAADLEEELASVKTELSVFHDEAPMRQILEEEASDKLRAMESEIEKAKKDTAAALVAANESEEKRREYKELLESTARRCHEALTERQAYLKESEKFRESLTVAEQEIARLGELLQREGNDNGDYLGSTSPCSLVTEVDANVQSASSQNRPAQSLAELEEAKASVPSRSTVNSWERKQQQRAPVSEKEVTIESLSRSLRASRMYCDEKSEQLEEAAATVKQQQETLKKINRELVDRKEECKVLENQVYKELKPALQAANHSLNERQVELKSVKEEFDLHQELTEKTRSALELQVESTTQRLQNTLAVLQDTQNELSKSEQRATDLEGQVTDLKEQRRETHEKMTELEQANEHRRESLRVMQERLVVIECFAANHQQNLVDTREENGYLERLLSQECERRETAEKRAIRKDGLVLELEGRVLELERNHAALKDHLAEKTSRITDVEEELSGANEIARLRDEALQEQANMCRRREALHESLNGELRMVIQSKESELRDTKDDLQSLERRVRSLSKSVQDERSKLNSRERELTNIARQCNDIEAENRRKKSKLSEAEDQYSRLMAEHQVAQEELETREKQIASYLASISEKARQVVDLRAEKTELEKTVLELRNLLVNEQNKFESQVDTSKKLMEDLKRIQTRVTTCDKDLSIRNTEVESLGGRLANAQNELLEQEGVIRDKDDQISSHANVVLSLEKALERSKHQLAVLESHLDGHDTLLKDNREKEESIAIKSGELSQAKELIAEMETELDSLRQTTSVQEEETASLTRKATSLETGKASVEEELERTRSARASVEQSLNDTSASLAALQKSTIEEIADLNTTIASLNKVINEKDSSLNSASEAIEQSSVHSNLTKEQLIDSRTRGDRLFSRLTATEYELASKKETLATLEQRFHESQEALKGKAEELERLEKTLLTRDKALSAARSKLDEMNKKASAITEGELLSMETKLDAKEKAIANLHSWCCFINGKLHAAEKALSERDMDLEISSTAFKKLEAQLHHQNELIAEKESQTQKLESSRVVENAELRSQIHSLQSHAEEAKSELERTKQIMFSKGSEAHSSLAAVSEELVECRTSLKSAEKETSELQSRRRNLEETVKTYERDLAASERTIERLTLDLGRLQSESSSKRDVKGANDKNASEEILKVRSETGYLIVELRKAEAELFAANENASTWQKKAEESQPLAESTLEAQRAVEIVSSELSLVRKDTKQKIDLLETQLKEAERERDAAERDCSTAIADYTAMRARLVEAHSRGSAYGRLAATNTLCTVTFVLGGHDAPGSDIMVYILGEDSTLGQWNPSRRLPVRVIGEGENGIIRRCEVVLPSNLSTAYKYTADGPDGTLVWEGDANRSLELHGDATRELKDVWRPPN